MSTPEIQFTIRQKLFAGILPKEHCRQTWYGPGTGGICVTHGDPIQAFWVEAEHRRPWALHRLQCAKGGMLELDFQGERLAGKSYLRPEETGVSAGDPAAVDAGHA